MSSGLTAGLAPLFNVVIVNMREKIAALGALVSVCAATELLKRETNY